MLLYVLYIVLQLHQVSLNSDEKQKSFIYNTFNGQTVHQGQVNQAEESESEKGISNSDRHRHKKTHQTKQIACKLALKFYENVWEFQDVKMRLH